MLKMLKNVNKCSKFRNVTDGPTDQRTDRQSKVQSRVHATKKRNGKKGRYEEKKEKGRQKEKGKKGKEKKKRKEKKRKEEKKRIVKVEKIENEAMSMFKHFVLFKSRCQQRRKIWLTHLPRAFGQGQQKTENKL